MTDGKTGALEKEVLGIFSKSFLKRYEGWKKRDLLLVALETMPKQVKSEKVIDNLIKLKSEFANRLNDEG